ncbi:ArnT family glycosyltransferase [Pontibacillus salipaludis]|uniref:Membrane protein n=1 Tax=Pontibacillus salipaludis TaxID=1697394 RepID=A0ABQ1Q2F1_9BACI|nr:glycosyltransferase family 39 protein [Pontibacillus salipaludis]GGD10387.1 membrane protein [Pontibacillus salipaludis]
MVKLAAAFQRFSIIVIMAFGIVFFIAGVLSNFQMSEELYSLDVFTLYLIGGLIGVLFVTFVLNNFFSTKWFVITLLSGAFIARFIWIFNADTQIYSDFSMLYNGAVMASNGDFSFTENSYFTKWVYQMGFVIYEAFVISLLGDHPFVLKFINVLVGTGTVGIIYLIGKSVFNELVGRVAGVLYAIYIPAIVMTSVLTNQYLATFLILSGIYLLVERFEKGKISWLWIGILFALGHIIRPIGPLVILAVGIFIMVVYVLKGNNKFTSSGKLLGILGTFFFVQMIISQAFIGAGITDYPLENRDPLWKFVVGLNHETTGTYSRKDARILSSLEGDAKEEKQKEMIEQRLSDKKEVFILAKDKFKLMWGDLDAAVNWSLYGIEAPDTKPLLFKIEKAMFTIFFLFGTVALFALFKFKESEVNPGYLFLLLLIIGYAMIHLIIEIQTRYRFFIMPSLIIVQSYGIYVIWQQSKLIKSGKKQEVHEEVRSS